MAPPPAVATPDALHREFARERAQSARRVNLLRFAGVSAFFLLFLVLGGLLKHPAWTGNFEYFAAYWTLSAVVFFAGRRSDRFAANGSLTIALVDVPMVFVLQWATLPGSPSPSGVAGFTVGVYVLLVILAALSLQNWLIWFTAAVATAFEVTLQYLADVSVGGMISTGILLALTATACSYARTRLVELVGRVDREIAEQRRAEQALRQSERMASLGTLAAGVAHEINTPLTYVVANLVLIAERLETAAAGGGVPGSPKDLATRLANVEAALVNVREANDRLIGALDGQLSRELGHAFGNAQQTIQYMLEQAELGLADLVSETQAALVNGGPASREQLDALLAQAREGADRVRTIVRDLKMLSRPDEESAAAVDVWRVLDSSVNLASSEIQYRAHLRTVRGAVPRVMASESRLGQVFVNLLVNAAQAITTADSAANEISITTHTDGAGRAVVRIRDTGAGIPADVMERLFDPFFTTKPVGEGTGLGLAICHGIVASLGGELTAESEVGRGSTFTVALPAAPRDAYREPAPVAEPEPGPPVRPARVLLVDDDPGIGQVIRAALGTDHDVETVTSAVHAFACLSRGERFDVILCDVMMPVMTGIELHSRVDPDMAARMIFLTGGAFTADAQAFLERGDVRHLDKPFDVRQLRSLVRASVERERSPQP